MKVSILLDGYVFVPDEISHWVDHFNAATSYRDVARPPYHALDSSATSKAAALPLRCCRAARDVLLEQVAVVASLRTLLQAETSMQKVLSQNAMVF